MPRRGHKVEGETSSGGGGQNAFPPGFESMSNDSLHFSDVDHERACFDQRPNHARRGTMGWKCGPKWEKLSLECRSSIKLTHQSDDQPIRQP